MRLDRDHVGRARFFEAPRDDASVPPLARHDSGSVLIRGVHRVAPSLAPANVGVEKVHHVPEWWRLGTPAPENSIGHPSQISFINCSNSLIPATFLSTQIKKSNPRIKLNEQLLFQKVERTRCQFLQNY